MSLKETIKKIAKTGNTDNYEIVSKIGSGRYGEVFEAINNTNNRKVAIKVLKPVRTEKVIREIKILKMLSGGPNIIRLRDIVVNNDTPSLIFSFISKETLKSVAQYMDENEMRFYLQKLMRAIDFTHKNNIIHRDIKPTNIVIDRNRKILRLIDWGLADVYAKDKEFSVTVASRYYKSPELLCKYTKYDFSLDIWSFGCVVAELIFKKEPFFRGMDNLDQLKTICMVLGSQCLRDYIKKYKLNETSIQTVFDLNLKRRNWKDFIVGGYASLVSDMAIDFVDKLLVFDHKSRLTSEEALSHPFFYGFN